MKTLVVIVLGIILIWAVGKLFQPRSRRMRYSNSMNIRNSNGVKITQGHGTSEVDLEVVDDRNIILNGHDIEIPRRIRHGFDNPIINFENDHLYVNGHKYDKYTGLFSSVQEFEV